MNDPFGNQMGMVQTSNSWVKEYVTLGSRPFVLYQSGNTYFLHANPLGSTSAVTDQTGALAQDSLYYPFGWGWDYIGSMKDERFAGLEERDPQLGFDPSATREYPSNQGRWLTPDPGGKNVVRLDDPRTWNMYAYVRNNPTTLTDPSGECIEDPLTYSDDEHFKGGQ